MINLAMSEMEKKEESQPMSALYDTPNYPYGLKIQIDAETYKKLGFTEPPDVDAKMMLMAKVEVCSVYKEPGKGDEKNYSMGLQITDMELKEMPEQESEETPESSVEDVIYKEG